MKRLLMILGGMCISIVMASAGDRIHDKDSVLFSVGLNLGFGFDANSDYRNTPFVFEPMFDVEYCFSNNFLFGLSIGWNYLHYSHSESDIKFKTNQHIFRSCPFVGFAIGDYEKFNFKIGPTCDCLFGLKSVCKIDGEKYVDKLSDIDVNSYKYCALGLRMGVGICNILEIYYQLGLTKHMEGLPKAHQVTFVLPLRANSKFAKNQGWSW